MGLSISSDNSLTTQDLLLKLNQNYLNVTMGVAYSRYVRISVLMKFSLKDSCFYLNYYKIMSWMCIRIISARRF